MYKKLCLFTVLFIFIDQVSKGIINTFMHLNNSIKVIGDFLNITYVHNYGAAFSMFENARIIFIIITIIALNLIYFYLIKDKKLNNLQSVTYGMLLGGIIGNLVDRVLYGYVLDFIDVKGFAIFNIADSFIVISVIILIVQEVFYARGNSRRK